METLSKQDEKPKVQNAQKPSLRYRFSRVCLISGIGIIALNGVIRIIDNYLNRAELKTEQHSSSFLLNVKNYEMGSLKREYFWERQKQCCDYLMPEAEGTILGCIKGETTIPVMGMGESLRISCTSGEYSQVNIYDFNCDGKADFVHADSAILSLDDADEILAKYRKGIMEDSSVIKPLEKWMEETGSEPLEKKLE